MRYSVHVAESAGADFSVSHLSWLQSTALHAKQHIQCVAGFGLYQQTISLDALACSRSLQCGITATWGSLQTSQIHLFSKWCTEGVPSQDDTSATQHADPSRVRCHVEKLAGVLNATAALQQAAEGFTGLLLMAAVSAASLAPASSSCLGKKLH